MRNNYWVIGVATLLVLTLLWFALQDASFGTDSVPVVPAVDGTVVLSFGKYNYVPDTITAEVGKPLRITADLRRITGCFRSFRVPALGVSDYFSETHDTIEFTPQKKGTFLFTCNMGMGKGTLNVV